MSDAPEWLADAVEAAALAHCHADHAGATSVGAEVKGCDVVCPVCVFQQRAALAAFLRRVETTALKDEQGRTLIFARTPSLAIAAAIERLGAPEKPDAP